MSTVVGLRRATLLWSPPEGEVVAVHSLQELEALISSHRAYAEVATVSPADGGSRTATVTGLNEDGWLAKVRHKRMVQDGWTYSKLVVRKGPDGTVPSSSSWSSFSKLYSPADASDLAGHVVMAEEIQFAPAQVAGAVWAWLTGSPMPEGLAVGNGKRDLVAFDSVIEAIDWLARFSPRWSDDAVAAVTKFAEGLAPDRVIAVSPQQISIRPGNGGNRVRFSRRRGEDDICVSGAVDELGREYRMRLPSMKIEWIRPPRTRS